MQKSNVSFLYDNEIFLYNKNNPPIYHYSIYSHSIKLTEACQIQIKNSLPHCYPPLKITYHPCPNMYICHIISKYHNCINLTQSHVSLAIHLNSIPFLFFIPFFLLFLFFKLFCLLFLFFRLLN